ncbi:helix-turn-helix transcriptional regulator [Amycolatopsis sp. NPDC051071]|uniref:helix-turn-helix domain-containing protein n=1 Tax=Amycolatopsis sp. NPDC051071 TaxID=3154637 RepID=UPI003414884D
MSETGNVLRAARLEAKIGLDYMAKKTSYSKSMLSLVENGKRTATPELVAAYERTLDVQGLGEDVNRRELLAAVAAMAAGAAAPEPLSRLLDGLVSPDVPSKVGTSEVEAVLQATNAYTAIDLRLGGAAAADVSTGALKWAVSLLDASMTDTTRTALSSAVAALADRTAWTHYDAGRKYSARRLAELALATADAGNDRDLRAHVLIDTASQIGKDAPAEAAKIVSVALSDTRVCTLEQANLHAVCARHLANAGETSQARRHIHLAEQLSARGGDAPVWATFLTLAHVDKLITESLSAAGERKEAIRRFEAILPQFGSDRARAKAGIVISLGTLYAHEGRLEQARDLADQAAAALADVRSGRAAGSLQDLRRLLTTSQ